MTTVEIDDQYLVPGRPHPTHPRPDRVYKVYRVANKWSVWCYVNPPLTGGHAQNKTTMVSESFLLRGTKL